MSGKIVVDIESNEGKLLQAFQKIQTGNEKLESSFSKSARGAADLERAAKRIYDGTRTPQEQFIAKNEEINRLFKAGKLDAETYGRAVKQAMDQAAASTEQVQTKTAAMGGTLKDLIGKYGDLAAAIGLTKKAGDDISAKAESAAQRQVSARVPMSKLKQVSESKAEYLDLQEKARSFYRAGGAGSEEEAASVVFDVKSAGQMDQLPFLQKMRSSGFVSDTGEAVKSAITLQTAMGKKETGTLRDLMNKAVVASGPSPVSTEALLTSAGRIGTEAGALKISDEELLSSLSLVSTATGSSDEAATRLGSLMTSLGEIGAPPKPGEPIDPRKRFNFKGKTLREMVKDVEGRKFNDRELMELLGRKEAVSAFRLIGQNSDQIASLEKDVTGAQLKDVIGERMSWTTPEEQAVGQRNRAEARNNLSQQKIATDRNKSEAWILNKEAQLREMGAPEAVTWGVDKGLRALRWASGTNPGPEGLVPAARSAARDFRFGTGVVPQVGDQGGGTSLKEILDQLKQNDENAEKRANKPTPSTPPSTAGAQAALRNQGEPAGL